MQGKPNSNIKTSEKVCDEADENCCKVATDSDNKADSSSILPKEDDANGMSRSGEPRPSKKAKREMKKNECSDALDNGNLNITLTEL